MAKRGGMNTRTRLATSSVAGLAVGLTLLIPGAAGASTGHKPSSSCVTAIRDYQQLDGQASQAFTVVGHAFDVAANYPAQYGPIATAIQNDDVNSVNSIVAKVKGWTSQIDLYTSNLQTLEAQIGALKSSANAAAAKCEAGH
jgi:hypothetical protein